VDFVLVSVHLKPDAGPANRARRQHELASIAAWIDANNEVERDFIILGDTNIQNAGELANATPPHFASLNDECWPTNTKGDKPYDHVMFLPGYSTEVDLKFDMAVVDLVKAMRGRWRTPSPYPGDPYDHNEFRKFYSDHHPVVFRLRVPAVDDD